MTDRARRWRIGGLAGGLFCFGVAAAMAQERLVEEPDTFPAAMLGDWFAVGGDPARTTYRVRLDADGTFRHGSAADFGRYRTRWESGRVTLAGREALTVRWAEEGPCTYYVTLIKHPDRMEMIWRPFRDERDFGAYDGIITRAIMPEGPCRERMWHRRPRPAGETP